MRDTKTIVSDATKPSLLPIFTELIKQLSQLNKTNTGLS